jgi:butyryl-CoA:acetate CoA-transferase
MKIPAEESPFTWNSIHMTGAVRNLIQNGNVFYLPIRFSETPRYYRENAPAADVVVFQVTPMDEHGFFNFGPSVSQIAASCDRGKVIIVEVNTNIPKCYGGFEADIHISKVDMVIEGDNPMPGILPAVEGTPTDEAIARYIAEEIPSGACLQLGIGGMPGVVGKMLAQSDVKDLGVHSEMYVDAFVVLSKAGKVTGKYKALDRYRQGFSFAAGTQELYDFLNENSEIMAAPVDYINDIRVISAMDKFISVNSCVEVDLFGQANGETSGLRHISGSGGQQDFVLGAYLSKGGKSFIALPSTYKTKDGTLKSRLIASMPQGSVITDTRTNIHYLVTENGKVNLKGLTTWQRAEAIISIAHPQFQDELVAQAEKMHVWRKANKRNF